MLLPTPLRQPPITLRLWLWFVLIALAPLSLVTWLTYNSSQQALQAEAINNLRSIADSKMNRIEVYADERLRDATALAIRPTLVQAAQEYTKAFYQSGLDSPEYQAVEAQLRSFLTFYMDVNQYADLFIISEAGDAVFSVQRGEDLGSNYYSGIYRETELARVFDRAKTLISPQISAYSYYPATNEPAIFVAAPIFDQGVVIGVLVLQIDNRELYQVVNDYTGLGDSGETIVGSWIEDRVVFVAPLRHDPYAAFRRRIRLGSPMAQDLQQAVQGRTSFGLHTDYRNQEVLSVQRYLPSLDWGMVVKIDTVEVFAPARQQRNLTLVIGGLTLVLVSLGAVWASRHFTQPILQLTAAARHMAKGHLNEQVPIHTHDELGTLGLAFNQMSAELSESYHTLEQKVEQRTHRLAALIRLSQALLESLDEAEICRRIVDGLQDKALGYEYIGLFLVDPETGERVLQANIGWPEAYDLRLKSGHGLSERPLLDGQVHHTPDVSQEPDYISALDTGAEVDVPIFIQGQVDGTLVVESSYPNAFSQEDIDTLTAAALLGGVSLSNARLFKTLDREKSYTASLLNTLQEEINQAHHIQKNLLPAAMPHLEQFDLVCFSISAKEVGGDFFTYHSFAPHHLAVAVGDVSGKGMPAALLMGVGLAHFATTIVTNPPAGDLLARLDQALVPYTKTTRQNCALVYVELKETLLTVANAGCITPLLRRQDGSVEWLMAGGMPLGVGLGAEIGYLPLDTDFTPGEVVILVSDGVIEAKNSEGQMFGFERLEQAAATAPDAGSQVILNHLVTLLSAFINQPELHDDMTLVVLRHHNVQ